MQDKEQCHCRDFWQFTLQKNVVNISNFKKKTIWKHMYAMFINIHAGTIVILELYFEIQKNFMHFFKGAVSPCNKLIWNSTHTD